jgi:amino acid transporter
MYACIAVVLMMVAMNVRGVKESVLSLLPIFIAFVLMHTLLVVYAIVAWRGELPAIAGSAIRQVHDGIASLGTLGLAIVFFRAYSMGAGTYTGIEAVSNGLPILREPRAETGKRTMLYMAASLAFIAGGILIAYLLEAVQPYPGKTLNAVLFEQLTARWRVGGFSLGPGVVTFTLLTEGALLFVAAQTGFVGGPQVLATMAVDRWVPRRFASLSERLVTQDGVLAMGLAATLILFQTRAEVSVLVVLYAINVFVTFTLSQLGMSRLWWTLRGSERKWIRKLMVNGIGCLFTAVILFLTVTLKFNEGGWMTVAMTGSVAAACFMVRRHYERVNREIERLEVEVLPRLFSAPSRPAALRDPALPTAVLMVNGYNGLGLATLTNVANLFPGQFSNVVFICVGEVDSALFRGPEELQQLETRIADDLLEYCELAADLGFHAELRAAIGTDVVIELRRLCFEVAREFRHCVFFAGQLVFSDELNGFMSRFLHNHTALDLLQSLQMYGFSLVILPVRVAPAPSPDDVVDGLPEVVPGLGS